MPPQTGAYWPIFIIVSPWKDGKKKYMVLQWNKLSLNCIHFKETRRWLHTNHLNCWDWNKLDPLVCLVPSLDAIGPVVLRKSWKYEKLQIKPSRKKQGQTLIRKVHFMQPYIHIINYKRCEVALLMQLPREISCTSICHQYMYTWAVAFPPCRYLIQIMAPTLIH